MMPQIFSKTPGITPHQHASISSARSPSPGYFGLAVARDGVVSSSGARMVKDNLGSPTASIRSAAASPPQNLSISASNDQDIYQPQQQKKKSEHGTFSLNQGGLSQYGITPRCKTPDRSETRRPSNNARSEVASPKAVQVPLKKAESMSEADLSIYSRSPKRHLSHDPSVSARLRRDSPAVPLPSANEGRDIGSPPQRLGEDKHPRLSLPSKGPLAAPLQQLNRGETLPSSLEQGAAVLATPQHIHSIVESHGEETLILDLRVFTQYEKSHLSGALNLCVPTTLLKRPSYNVQKLVETFKDSPVQQAKFEKWRSCKTLIVYDAASTQMKEAINCVNILKKFLNEGWSGEACIIRGGFAEFAKKFPKLVEKSESAPSSAPVSKESTVAPVIGGCPMPATKSAANPFFGNIRQNMDLIAGVGQMDIRIPPSFKEREQWSNLPQWLRKAADESDKGRSVAEKFEQIEKREQKRMQEALSAKVAYGTPGSEIPGVIRIAGIEKGSKNRYNNIWPYEHSRIRLTGIASCDYINASLVQTSLSHKKYIATQAPVPATFNDFWAMIWQYDIRVIVMLTAETEGGQKKADNYWESKQYGHMKVKFLKERKASLEPNKIRRHRERPSISQRSSLATTKTPESESNYFAIPTVSNNEAEEKSAVSEEPFVTVRKFTLSHEAHPFERMREITQLQYSSWPDFGVPAHPAHLLGLVEQCDAVVNANQSGYPYAPQTPEVPTDRPVLVHCSAGCGRSGTFCAVDSVVDMLKRQRQGPRHTSPMEVDAGKGASSVDDSAWIERDDQDLIDKTVEEFRLQRLSMVQSLRQFVLCYETVLEWMSRQTSANRKE